MNNIRTYGRTELAQAYFPNITPKSAWEKLRSLMATDEELSPLLSTGRRSFLPAEVAIIFGLLGQP